MQNSGERGGGYSAGFNLLAMKVLKSGLRLGVEDESRGGGSVFRPMRTLIDQGSLFGRR